MGEKEGEDEEVGLLEALTSPGESLKAHLQLSCGILLHTQVLQDNFTYARCQVPLQDLNTPLIPLP